MSIPDTLAGYRRRQQYKPGWQDLSALLCTSILAAASRDEGHAFLHRAGTQLARQFPLPATETLGELEDEVNHLLAHFDWGAVQMTADDRGLAVTHLAWPHAGQADSLSTWATGFSSLMEGCWSEWLQALGGTQEMTFNLTGQSVEALNFRYQTERN
jgi:hypothetical protein